MINIQQLFRNKVVRISVVFFGLAVLYFLGYNRMMFSSEIVMQNQAKEVNIAGELNSARVIQQNIKIPNNYNKQYIDMNIFFATYQRTNTSSLEISLIQNETRDTVDLDSGKLKDNTYYRVRFDEEFKPGNALLEIRSKDATSGNSITLALTEDVSQGTAIVDGVEQKQFGILHQEFFSVKDWSKLFFLFFLLIFILTYFKTMGILSSKINYNFLLSIIIIVTFVTYRFPSLVLSNEIWAEGATNFFINASEKGWLANLGILDAGYLPLFTRFITLTLVKVLHVDMYFPFISQFIAILLIASFASVINFNYLNKILPSNFLRFLIGIVLGMGLFYDYELFTFINFSYMGVVPGLFVLFVEFEKIKKWKIICLSLLFFLILSSKAYFIVFLPIYILLLIYNLYKRKYKSVSFYSVTSVSMILQLLVMLINRSTWVPEPGEQSLNSNLFHLIFQSISLYLKNVYFLIFRLNSSHSILTTYLILITLIIITIMFFYINKKQLSATVLMFVVATQLLALMSNALSMTVPYIKSLDVWNMEFDIPLTRHFIFSNIFIFLGVIVWLTNLSKLKKQQILVGSLIIIMYCFTGFTAADQYKYGNYSFSNWKESYTSYETGACTAVNPYPWVICKPGKQVYPIVKTPASPIGIHTVDIKSIVSGGENWKVEGMYIDKGNAWNRKIKVVVYNEKDKPISEAVESNDYSKKYGYFKFNSTIQINYVKFFDEFDNEVALDNPTLIMFGPS